MRPAFALGITVAFRWLGLPFACFAAWVTAITLGFFLRSLCVSETSGSTWSRWGSHLSLGLIGACSAVFTLIAAYATAPAERTPVIWIVYGIGFVAAMALGLGPLVHAPEGFFGAAIAGFLTVLALMRFDARRRA